MFHISHSPISYWHFSNARLRLRLHLQSASVTKVKKRKLCNFFLMQSQQKNRWSNNKSDRRRNYVNVTSNLKTKLTSLLSKFGWDILLKQIIVVKWKLFVIFRQCSRVETLTTVSSDRISDQTIHWKLYRNHKFEIGIQCLFIMHPRRGPKARGVASIEATRGVYWYFRASFGLFIQILQ